jgi:hypothetical protein
LGPSTLRWPLMSNARLWRGWEAGRSARSATCRFARDRAASLSSKSITTPAAMTAHCGRGAGHDSLGWPPMNADVSLTPGRRMPTFGTIATRTTPSNTCAPTPTRNSVTTNGSCGSSFPTTPCELTSTALPRAEKAEDLLCQCTGPVAGRSDAESQPLQRPRVGSLPSPAISAALSLPASAIQRRPPETVRHGWSPRRGDKLELEQGCFSR